MSVIAFASIKGGVGKTTALACLADHLCAGGLRVHVVDADPNGHAYRLSERMSQKLGDESRFWTTEQVDEGSIRQQIRAARLLVGATGTVLVDLPGVAAKTTLFGLGLSDRIIVPIGPSGMDVTDALRTLDLIGEASDFIQRRLETSILLTRWPVQIETRIAREARERLVRLAPEIPQIPVPLMQRVQLSEMTMTYQAPRVAEPGGNAAGNVTAVCRAIMTAATEVGAAA